MPCQRRCLELASKLYHAGLIYLDFYFLQGDADVVVENLAAIYVWLKYSSSRKLTWQRNYNTQPRILGDAQQRLTAAIVEAKSSCQALFPAKLSPDPSKQDILTCPC